MENTQEFREPVEILAAEFADRLRKGENPTISEYVSNNPELADEIRELFPTIVAMERQKVRRMPISSGKKKMTGPTGGRLGDYRIIREIGRGGMGIVYEAEQETLKRHVAVKVLPKLSLLDPKHLQRFHREAQTAARLHHTNIVPVFGVGHTDGFHYIVMQQIQGVGLDEILRVLRDPEGKSSSSDFQLPETGKIDAIARSMVHNKLMADGEQSEPSDISGLQETQLLPVGNDTDPEPLPTIQTIDPTPIAKQGTPYWQSVAEIGIQVADALEYAHRQGVLHRDIKPANLLLDNQGVLWITDFGLAKTIDDDQLSRTGDVIGTLPYMAPEQFHGRTDARSDIYSLGLTLYELVTLKPAFDDSMRSGLIHKITEGTPVRPCKLRPEVPRDLETIILKAIARNPKDRYASAAELCDDLHRFLEDRPIRARRTTPVEQAWRWARRNPLVAALLSTVGLLLVLVSIITSAGYVQAQAAERKIREALAGQTEQREKAEKVSMLALEALDKIYAQHAPSPTEGGSNLTVVDTNGESIDVPITPVLSKQSAAMLESLLVFYDRLAEQESDNLIFREETAKANSRVGAIRRDLGQIDEALAAYQRAMKLYQELAEHPDAESDYRIERAEIYNELGRVYAMAEDWDAAKQAHQQALKTLMDAGISVLSDTDRYQLARTHYLMATDIKGSPEGSTPPPGAMGEPSPGQLDGNQPRPPQPPFEPPRPGLAGQPHFGPGMGPPGRRDSGPNSPLGPTSGNNTPQAEPANRPTPDPKGLEQLQQRLAEREMNLTTAIELLEALCKKDDSVPAYQFLLARCYQESVHGRVLDQQAMENIEKATAILLKLVEEQPGIADYRHALIEAYSVIHIHGPQIPDSYLGVLEVRLEMALGLSKALIVEHPNVPEYIVTHIRLCHKMASLLERSGKLEDARKYLQEAIDRQSDLIAARPEVTSYRIWLATLEQTYARLLMRAGNFMDAKSHLFESIKVLRPLLEKDGKKPHLRSLLIDAYGRLSQAYDQLGDTEAAKKSLEFSQSLREAGPE